MVHDGGSGWKFESILELAGILEGKSYYLTHDTIQAQIDNDVGDVEAYACYEDNHEGVLPVSFWFVVPDEHSVGRMVPWYRMVQKPDSRNLFLFLTENYDSGYK